MDYHLVNVNQAAKEIGLSSHRVRQLCLEGRIIGASLVGYSWVIPSPVGIRPAARPPGRPRVKEAEGETV